MYFAGIDVGSTITKVVITKESEIISVVIHPTGAEHRRFTNMIMEKVLIDSGLSLDHLECIVATGYGRVNVPFSDRQVTEITCHAKGVSWLFPDARTIIDVGGQDSKGIKVSNGKVQDFIMNDKCAAGTGRFLEVIAETLDIPLEKLGELSLRAKNPSQISSTCALFAEEEVTTLLAKGANKNDIVAGIHRAVASRICAMVRRIGIEQDVVATGGGARNTGLVSAIEDHLDTRILRPPEPLITGALGAALIARELVRDRRIEVRKDRRSLEETTFFGG